MKIRLDNMTLDSHCWNEDAIYALKWNLETICGDSLVGEVKLSQGKMNMPEIPLVEAWVTELPENLSDDQLSKVANTILNFLKFHNPINPETGKIDYHHEAHLEVFFHLKTGFRLISF